MELSGSDEKRHFVLLIHGTFAFHEDEDSLKESARWWQRGSKFVTLLKSRCVDLRIVPAGQLVSAATYPWYWFWRKRHDRSITGDRDLVFHWSGANSETYRRTAGKRLYEHLNYVADLCDRDKCKFHVIAHSHGGSALFEALRLDFTAGNRKQQRGNKTQIVQRLATWTTIATPFMRFGPDWGRLVWILLFLAALGLLGCRQMDWWWDYWNQHGLPSAYCPLTTFLWYTAGHLALVMACILPLQVGWSIFQFNRSKDEHCERYKQGQIDLISSLITAAVFVLATWLLYYIAGIETREIFWKETWEFEVLAATGLGVAYLVAALLGFWQLVMVFLQWNDARRRTKQAQGAWQEYKDRRVALPVGFETKDEAVRGLRALVQKPALDILPRWPAPSQDRYSPNKQKLNHPEWELEQQRFGPWFVGYAFLPMRVIVDWVLRPFYNDVFCRLVDDFVVTRLWRFSVGCDLVGARIVDCAPLPVVEDLAATMGNNWTFTLAAAEKRVSMGTTGLLNRVRLLLGGDFAEGVKVSKLFGKAMAGDGGEDYLYHTAYLGTAEIVEDFAAMYCATKPWVPGRPTMPTGPTPDSTEESECVRESDQLEFLGAFVRTLVRAAIVVLPALLIGLLGYALYYPWSSAKMIAQTDSLKSTLFAKSPYYPHKVDGRARKPLVEYLATISNGDSQLLEYAARAQMPDDVLAYIQTDLLTRLVSLRNFSQASTLVERLRKKDAAIRNDPVLQNYVAEATNNYLDALKRSPGSKVAGSAAKTLLANDTPVDDLFAKNPPNVPFDVVNLRNHWEAHKIRRILAEDGTLNQLLVDLSKAEADTKWATDAGVLEGTAEAAITQIYFRLGELRRANELLSRLNMPDDWLGVATWIQQLSHP